MVAFKVDATKPTVTITTPGDGARDPAGQGRGGASSSAPTATPGLAIVRRVGTVTERAAEPRHVDDRLARVLGDRHGQGRQHDGR